jgi:hypothetical protein
LHFARIIIVCVATHVSIRFVVPVIKMLVYSNASMEIIALFAIRNVNRNFIIANNVMDVKIIAVADVHNAIHVVNFPEIAKL